MAARQWPPSRAALAVSLRRGSGLAWQWRRPHGVASGLAAWQSKWPRVWVISSNSFHTAASISTRHIIMASPPVIAVLAQRTAASISARHIILASPPVIAGQAQHAAASISARHIIMTSPSHRIRFSGIFVFVFVITCRDESRWLSLSISETSDCQHGIFLVSFKIELYFRSHVTKETKKNGIFLISFCQSEEKFSSD